MAADVLTTKWAKASTTMAYFSQDIVVLAPKY